MLYVVSVCLSVCLSVHLYVSTQSFKAAKFVIDVLHMYGHTQSLFWIDI